MAIPPTRYVGDPGHVGDHNDMNDVLSAHDSAISTLQGQVSGWAVDWGDIGGTLSNQSDLNTALGAKAPTASPTFTGTVTLPSSTSIGNVSSTEIGYLDNASSNLQSQISAKAPTASPTFTGKVTTAASASGGAGFRLPHGSAPTTPTDGDFWTTTVGVYARINGITQGPFEAAAGTYVSLTADESISGIKTFIGTVILPGATTSIGDVSATELGYLNGVTGAIQTQFGTKAPLASPTFTGKVTTAASASGGAGFNLPHGDAPTSPVNGDLWTATSGLFARINGATEQYAKLSNPTFSGTVTATTFDGTLSGTATNATKVAITDDTATNATMYPTWVTTASSNQSSKVSSTKLTFNPSTGVLSATTFSGSGASLTSVPAGQLSGTIPSGVLGNSTVYIGTTAVALNRASASLALTGISSIDGSAASATNATNATNVAISNDTSTNATYYPTFTTSTTGNLAQKVANTKLTFNPSSGVLSATTFSGSGASLTNVPAAQLSGTIPSAVLGNSTVYIGTTAVALNRSSGSLALTGITSIDGSAASASTATTATNATNTAITNDTTTAATMYPTWVTTSSGNQAQKTSSTKLTFNPSTGTLAATVFSGSGASLSSIPQSAVTNLTTDLSAKAPIANPSFTGTVAATEIIVSPSGEGTLTLGDVTAATSTDAGLVWTGTSGVTSGAFTEVNGELLSYGVNVTQVDSTPDTSRSGGIFRIDTRSGYDVFTVLRAASGASTQYQALDIDLNTGTMTVYGPLDALVNFNDKSANYTLALTDAGKMVTFTGSSAQTLTVPPNSSVAFPVGTQIDVCRYGTGSVTFAQGSGVTIVAPGGATTLTSQYSMGTLIKRATDTWILTGDVN